MNTASAPMPDARRTSGVIADRMRKVKGAALGAAMGKSEDWARKVLDGDQGVRLDDVETLLFVLGLKAVEKSKVCVDPELARAYETIAKKAMNTQQLIWDDAE